MNHESVHDENDLQSYPCTHLIAILAAGVFFKIDNKITICDVNHESIQDKNDLQSYPCTHLIVILAAGVLANHSPRTSI